MDTAIKKMENPIVNAQAVLEYTYSRIDIFIF